MCLELKLEDRGCETKSNLGRERLSFERKTVVMGRMVLPQGSASISDSEELGEGLVFLWQRRAKRQRRIWKRSWTNT